MKQLNAVIAAGSAITALSLMGARANGQGEVRIYAGEPVGPNGISIMSWGSGEARQSEEHVLLGSNSLKIVTHGRYQGARLVLANPLSVKSMMSDPSAYLQFMVVLPNKESLGRMGSDYGMMGGSGGMGRMSSMMGGRGGQGKGGRGGQGGLEGGSGSGGGKSQLVKPKPLGALRLVIRTSDGNRSESVLSIENAVRLREDWTSLSIPLTMLSGLKSSNGEIKELNLFGDSPATIYLGEVRVVRDETPIRVDELAERTVPQNDNVTFTASAEAGVSPVKYEWDFNSGDGVDVDAEGKTVTHKFRKSLKDSNGNTLPYLVTLRVVDPFGIKKPVIRTTKVYVTL